MGTSNCFLMECASTRKAATLAIRTLSPSRSKCRRRRLGRPRSLRRCPSLAASATTVLGLSSRQTSTRMRAHTPSRLKRRQSVPVMYMDHTIIFRHTERTAPKSTTRSARAWITRSLCTTSIVTGYVVVRGALIDSCALAQAHIDLFSC